MKLLWSEEQARVAAEGVLGCRLDAAGCAPCPGRARHTQGDGVRDFRVFLTGHSVPAGTCFHQSCYAEVTEFNRRLWMVMFGKRGSDVAARMAGVKPVAEVVRRRQDFDLELLRREQCPGVMVDEGWLAERSPVDPEGVTPADFLDGLYEPGERVLVFTRFFSQGDFGYRVGGDGKAGEWVRLGDSRGVKPVGTGSRETPGELLAAKEGVWFLCQPVDGRWHLDGDLKDKVTGLPRWTRRSKLAVTRWRYLVLESDCAPADLWLNFLAGLRLRMAALYTSGGKSVHALVRVNEVSKAEWDATRDRLCPVLSKVGADAAAMSAVRLSRLPGCMRRGRMGVEVDKEGRRRNVYVRYERPRMQRLLFLDRNPEPIGIVNLPRRRGAVMA